MLPSCTHSFRPVYKGKFLYPIKQAIIYLRSYKNKDLFEYKTNILVVGVL